MLTTQSCPEIMQWKHKLNNSLYKTLVILLIIIWSQSASILTKAFAGNLLEIYFNRISFPIVETIQDIYLNKKISIAASSIIFRDYSRRIDESNDMKSNILARIMEFENKFKYSELDKHYYKEFIIRKLINGEIVILMESQKVREFEIRWEHEKTYFEVSSYKYNPNYCNYFVSKNNPNARALSLL